VTANAWWGAAGLASTQQKLLMLSGRDSGGLRETEGRRRLIGKPADR
jgi:hypothetical protein